MPQIRELAASAVAAWVLMSQICELAGSAVAAWALMPQIRELDCVVAVLDLTQEALLRVVEWCQP